MYILPATDVLILTDHSNLQFLWSSSNQRVRRWAVSLSEFPFTIEWHPGPENSVADVLSRLVKGVTPKASVKTISQPSPAPAPLGMRDDDDDDDDEEQQEVSGGKLCPRPTEEAVVDLKTAVEQLPHNIVEGRIVLVEPPPPGVLARIFALAHEDILAGHFGVARTTQIIKSTVDWTGIDASIANLTAQCVVCQKLKATRPAPSEILSTMAKRPFESVFIDFLGPLKNDHGFQHILVMVDRFSGYVVAEAVKDTRRRRQSRTFCGIVGFVSSEFQRESQQTEQAHLSARRSRP